MKIRRSIGVTLLLLMPALSWGQQVYRFIDESGRVVFTDRPPEQADVQALSLGEQGSGESVQQETPSPQDSAERMELMMEMADRLQQDRYERADRRAAAREASEPAPETAQSDDQTETHNWVSSGIWYPVRPPMHWWPRPPGHYPPRPPWHPPGPGTKPIPVDRPTPYRPAPSSHFTWSTKPE